MKFFNVIFIAILIVACNGCGYKLGLAGKDESIRKIYVYTVINETRKPGLEMPMTNAVINAFHYYGSGITVTNHKDEADTFLIIKLTTYDRAPARFNRADIVEESVVNIYAEFQVYRSKPDRNNNIDGTQVNGIQLIKPYFDCTVSASTTYFLSPNQPEGERSIQNVLLDKLARKIVDNIVYRWSSRI